MDIPPSNDGDAHARSRLDKARLVYCEIFRALQESLATLRDGEDSTTEARSREGLLKSHLKQLQTVFDIEGSLEEFGHRQTVTRLDLDAARDEIRQRLARIREQGGD